jgi:hypothetical protein
MAGYQQRCPMGDISFSNLITADPACIAVGLLNPGKKGLSLDNFNAFSKKSLRDDFTVICGLPIVIADTDIN